MIYLSQLVGNPVLDLNGEKIGTVSDLGIATGEVFPRVTSLAFMGPGHTPFMISWRKYVDTYDEHEVHLKVVAADIRFSYLQPNEVLLARDILNKQIVDTRGMRVVRVNDLKLSDTNSTQLRLLGKRIEGPALRCQSICHQSLANGFPKRRQADPFPAPVQRDLLQSHLLLTDHSPDDRIHRLLRKTADAADLLLGIFPVLPHEGIPDPKFIHRQARSGSGIPVDAGELVDPADHRSEPALHLCVHVLLLTVLFRTLIIVLFRTKVKVPFSVFSVPYPLSRKGKICYTG